MGINNAYKKCKQNKNTCTVHVHAPWEGGTNDV